MLGLAHHAIVTVRVVDGGVDTVLRLHTEPPPTGQLKAAPLVELLLAPQHLDP